MQYQPQKAYRIIKFAERHHSKAAAWVKDLQFVQAPVGYKSKSKRWLLHQHKAAGERACWAYMEMVQLAAAMPIRGVLAERDHPLTDEEIAMHTGLRLATVKLALKLLTAPSPAPDSPWHPWLDQIPWPVPEHLIERQQVKRSRREFTVCWVNDGDPSKLRHDARHDNTMTQDGSASKQRHDGARDNAMTSFSPQKELELELEPPPISPPGPNGQVASLVRLFDEWARADGKNGLRSDEELDLTRRLDAMDGERPWIPEAIRQCRKEGCRFKSVAYAMKAALNRVDELRRAPNGAERAAPAPTPQSVYEACTRHVAYGGVKVGKDKLGWHRKGLLRDGKLWVPADKLAEVAVDG